MKPIKWNTMNSLYSKKKVHRTTSNYYATKKPVTRYNKFYNTDGTRI